MQKQQKLKNTVKNLSSFLLFLSASCFGSASNNAVLDATMIPFEELIATKFIPASTIANQVSNASSAVSIVTAQDIKDYGYRTLGDILGSMKGLFVSQIYKYTMLGGRGYPNNEYAGRIIVLIDGYRADDSYFGQAYLGNDGILDVALIERVEYIPGGGSAGYGDGALLGAINIITKKGSDIGGIQVASGFGSQHARQQRVTAGGKLDNGANILLSASSFGVDGTTYKEGDNDEKNKRFFAKYDSDNFSFVGAYAKRDIHNPTYDPLESIVYGDENAFILLKYHTDITSNLKLSTSLWQGHYIYSTNDFSPLSSFAYTYDSKQIARWYGGDVKLIGTWFDQHTISFGAGYRNDYRWRAKETFYDLLTNDITYYDGVYQPRKTYSLYVYDDFVILPSLSLNYGLRYENSDNNIHALSPHAAVIWKPLDETVLKLSAGKSNRQATPEEGGTAGYYTKPEQAKTIELVLEQQLAWQTKLTGSLYQYRISDRISSWSRNNIMTQGAEIALEKHWEDGTRLRTSYAKQNAEEESNGVSLGEIPSDIAKFNLSTPILNDQLRLGVEIQYNGKFPWYTEADTYHPDYAVVNVNLLAQKIVPHLDVNFLVHDLFNKSDKEVETFLPQSGRTFWLQLEYTFK
ncbi:MAG: TonB-dependent receptor [Sulfurospirillaceae bacterium]|nr:TonB-dependent receptor [Sulfurospirillaceae bacterium]